MTNEQLLLAASTVVQALATVVLVGVTIWYVRLTRGILGTSQAQLSDSRALLDASLQISRGHLRAVLAKISGIVEPLSPTQIPVEHLRRSGIWEMSDEDRIIQLSAGLGADATDIAGRLVAALSWLRQLHNRIERSNPTHGYGVGAAEARLYHQNRAGAERELRALQQLIG